MIKSDNKEPSKSTSWKVLETVMSHLKCNKQNPAKKALKIAYLNYILVWLVYLNKVIETLIDSCVVFCSSSWAFWNVFLCRKLLLDEERLDKRGRQCLSPYWSPAKSNFIKRRFRRPRKTKKTHYKSRLTFHLSLLWSDWGVMQCSELYSWSS